jgi:hypothetical protein
MDKSENAKVAKRRDFLKFASIGAASGATAAALGTPASAETAAPSETAAGYRETPHVKQAYDLARF